MIASGRAWSALSSCTGDGGMATAVDAPTDVSVHLADKFMNAFLLRTSNFSHDAPKMLTVNCSGEHLITTARSTRPQRTLRLRPSHTISQVWPRRQRRRRRRVAASGTTTTNVCLRVVHVSRLFVAARVVRFQCIRHCRHRRHACRDRSPCSGQRSAAARGEPAIRKTGGRHARKSRYLSRGALMRTAVKLH